MTTGQSVVLRFLWCDRSTDRRECSLDFKRKRNFWTILQRHLPIIIDAWKWLVLLQTPNFFYTCQQASPVSR